MGREVLLISYSREETLILEEVLHDLPLRTTLPIARNFQEMTKISMHRYQQDVLASMVQKIPHLGEFYNKTSLKQYEEDDLKYFIEIRSEFHGYS